MKASEAPEKIYISDYGSEVRYNWHPERLAVKDIEYTLTDAFIEKAEIFFAENMRCNGQALKDSKIEFIKDFKSYMKGE